MRRKDESKKPIIVKYMIDYFYEHDKAATVSGTGLPLPAVHRYLADMQEQRQTAPEHQQLLRICGFYPSG